MATEWSVITKENTNFARLTKLLIDGGTRVLRAIFDAKHPPHDLKKHLMDSRIHIILKNLRAKRLLRADQWNRLYPAVGSVTSARFDITLLSLLLRNICNLPTPANGWDTEPAGTSINVEDDIVRLRLYRNNLYGRVSEPALTDGDFNKYWNEIENVLLRHGIEKTAIDSLKTSGLALLPGDKMATGWSVITKENTNFARLGKLLIDGGTRTLRAIFDTKLPPHDLKKHLMDSRIHIILKNLRAKKILRPEQWNRLYPSVGSATSGDFDIPLLHLLLRNICNLPTPANGWDKEPAGTSINVEDDVVRLRLYRNNLYGRVSEPAVTDGDFNKYWNEIENVLLRFGIEKRDIDSLKTQPILDYEEMMDRVLDEELETSHSKPTKPTTSEVSRLPAEIIAQGPLAERSYYKALNYGKVEIYRACVKIIGQDRAGKTSLKRSLFGFPFNPEEESTVGVEVSLCTPITTNDVKRWQIKETDEGIIVNDDVARAMAIDIKMQGDLTGDTEGDNDGDDNDRDEGRSNPLNPATEVSSEPLEQADKPEVQQSPERKIDETIKDNRDTENHEATTKEILESSSKQNLPMPEGIKKSLIKYLEEKKIDETIKDTEVAISIWDFAGQQLFYASHPVFMSHRAIYILVYNLGKDLDDKAEPRARQGTREIVLDNASNETNLDNLLSWLVSVHCLCQPHTDSRVGTKDYICPPVIIVGTHADYLTGSEDEKQRLIDAKRRKIENAIEKCEFQNHVLKPFFVVDNNNSKDDDGIKSLHSKINEVLNMEPYFPEPVPIRWFHFEKALQSLVQEKKTPFLSVKELSEIAEQVCSIDQTEIAAMLNFYHDLGIIIKYGDTVVLDAKWLINLFKSLITIEPDEVKPRHRKFWRELAETGRLHTDLINHVFQELSEARDDAKKDILDMMEYFGLIAQIIPSNQKDGYCYLVPSHLTSSPEEELIKCQPSSDEPCPLYVRFLDGFIPHGLYFQLICRWCSIYGSQKQQTIFQKEPKLFRNAAKFVLDNNSKVIMTVVCCKSTIKVCLHSNREDKTGVDFKAVEIRQVIQESLDSLTEKCPWYQSLQYDLCIRCPSCALDATEKKEGQPFGDDNCLHPATDDEEFFCEVKDEWPEVSGLHHWFSRPTIEPSDRQSVRGDVRVSNGLFVVINIAKFVDRENRIGSEYDEKAMVELFGDYFSFEVVNLSKKNGAVEIKQELRNISSDKKYEDKDCFVLCIMSHGNEGVFRTCDGKKISYKDIFSYFKNDKCKSFCGKPKLFIIQACRGPNVDRGAVYDDGAGSSRNQREECTAIPDIPREADILVAFSCTEGQKCYRRVSSGSAFIQSLVRIFRNNSDREDVQSMLTMVNDDVSSQSFRKTLENEEVYVKLAPEQRNTLRKKVFLLHQSVSPPSKKRKISDKRGASSLQ